MLEVTWGSLGFIGVSLGAAGEVPGRPQGVLGEGLGGSKTQRFFQNVLGGSGGSPGMILVVGGGPRDRPGRWKC